MSKKKKLIRGKGISLKGIIITIASFAFAISALLTASLFYISNRYRAMNDYTKKYMEWENVAGDIQAASDYLTDQVRSYVVVGKKEYMDNYFTEAKVTKRRQNALTVLEKNLGTHSDIYKFVETATNESMNLMDLEYYAMRLVADVKGTDYSSYDEIDKVKITEEDKALSSEEKLQRASNIVYGEATTIYAQRNYTESKNIIISNIKLAVDSLDSLMQESLVKTSNQLKNALILQEVLIVTNIVFLAGLVYVLLMYFVKPARKAVTALEKDEGVTIKGIKEFNFIANIYNQVHEQNKNVKEELIYEAEHDKLTGLYNRTGYVSIYTKLELSKVIYILLDVDNFKQINDIYGHTVGDRVLIRLAKTINRYFSDENCYVFRIGGDEFTIIVKEQESISMDKLVKKLHDLEEEISKQEGDIPGSTLSIGVAHGKNMDTTDSLFKKADKALYKVKRHGRHDIAVYEK